MMEILNRRSLIKAIGMVGSISILPKMAFSSAVEHVVQMLNKYLSVVQNRTFIIFTRSLPPKVSLDLLYEPAFVTIIRAIR